MRKQKRNLGDILKVPFDGDLHIYARVIDNACCRFYDFPTTQEVDDMQAIITSRVLFTMFTSATPIIEGDWKVVGNVPLRSGEEKPPPMFQKKIAPKGSYQITYNRENREATKEECVGLEPSIIWGKQHVEERIRDHYAGRENIHLKNHTLNNVWLETGW